MKSKVSHISVLGIIISLIAVIILVASVFLIVVGFSSKSLFEGIASLPIGVGLFISSILLFAVAELVYNSQYQTKLLRKSIEENEIDEG